MSALPKAFLPEEGGAAQAVTEGAARKQVCIKVSLIRHCQTVTPSVLPQGGKTAPSQGSLPSLSLRDISPKGRDKLACAHDKKISRRKILREIVFYTSLFYLKYLTPFSKIGWYFSPKMF